MQEFIKNEDDIGFEIIPIKNQDGSYINKRGELYQLQNELGYLYDNEPEFYEKVQSIIKQYIKNSVDFYDEDKENDVFNSFML